MHAEASAELEAARGTNARLVAECAELRADCAALRARESAAGATHAAVRGARFRAASGRNCCAGARALARRTPRLMRLRPFVRKWPKRAPTQTRQSMPRAGPLRKSSRVCGTKSLG